jgi:hypothetical protein
MELALNMQQITVTQLETIATQIANRLYPITQPRSAGDQSSDPELSKRGPISAHTAFIEGNTARVAFVIEQLAELMDYLDV